MEMINYEPFFYFWSLDTATVACNITLILISTYFRVTFAILFLRKSIKEEESLKLCGHP